MVNIQARKLVPCRNEEKFFRALEKASCTRSCASSGSLHNQRAKLYKGSSKGNARASKSSLWDPLTSPLRYNEKLIILFPVHGTRTILPCSIHTGENSSKVAGKRDCSYSQNFYRPTIGWQSPLRRPGRAQMNP